MTKFFLIGGNLSIDFINTTIVEHGVPKDLLARPADFADWAVATHLVDQTKVERMVAAWHEHDPMHTFFTHVRRFRSTLRSMIADVAHGRAATETAIAAINAELHHKSGVVELRRTDGGFEKQFRADVNEPQHLLAPIAESAADLLCYGTLAYVKKCENAECVLYFYDTTKNHSRRWCSMAGCGNRAKVAAFYQRRRGTGSVGKDTL